MKRKIQLIFLLGAAVFLTYCSSTTYLPTHQNIVDAQDRWPEADSVYLYRGFDIYKSKCSGCHYLHKPIQYSLEEWQKILPEMKGKAKLTEAEFKPLKTYLFALCRQDSVALN